MHSTGVSLQKALVIAHVAGSLSWLQGSGLGAGRLLSSPEFHNRRRLASWYREVCARRPPSWAGLLLHTPFGISKEASSLLQARHVLWV